MLSPRLADGEQGPVYPSGCSNNETFLEDAMADKFVSVIRQDGSPGPLYGPYDYHEAERVLYAVLQSDKTENGPVEITADVEEVIDSDGSYSFDGGGGVYIVESEAFGDEEIDEEIDE